MEMTSKTRGHQIRGFTEDAEGIASVIIKGMMTGVLRIPFGATVYSVTL